MYQTIVFDGKDIDNQVGWNAFKRCILEYRRERKYDTLAFDEWKTTHFLKNGTMIDCEITPDGQFGSDKWYTKIVVRGEDKGKVQRQRGNLVKKLMKEGIELEQMIFTEVERVD